MLNGHSQTDHKLVFKTNYRLMQVKSIAECSKGSILQYFRPSLSYHLSLRSLFCLFLSCRFTQVLLYLDTALTLYIPTDRPELFACLVIVVVSADFFQNYFFSRFSSRNTNKVSNSLDSDQDCCSVSPDLVPICLQR